RWRGGGRGEPEVLASCYRACFAIASERQFRTIAFPAIATGIYGFPPEPAAAIAVTAARTHLAADPMPHEVIFVCFDAAMLETYRAALAQPAA
ncbi:MAG: macro domain-containing protein, partial [Thiohalocapsa sp.]